MKNYNKNKGSVLLWVENLIWLIVDELFLLLALKIWSRL